jgi:AcrR family transcriptional regulator
LNRSESKYFATAARMDEAFLELLEQKDFAYITVKELCAKSGVNRSTFYLHYETLADLLAESAQHIIDRFVAAMPHDTQEFLEKLPERPVEELYLITPEYLVPYLTYVKEHRRVFRTTVEQASALRMTDAYEALSRHVFLPILNRFGVSAADREYLMAFYISGLMAIINRWLQADCQDSIEHIISVMQTCITRGARQAKRASQ